MHSFTKYCVYAYYMPGTVLHAGDTIVNWAVFLPSKSPLRQVSTLSSSGPCDKRWVSDWKRVTMECHRKKQIHSQDVRK